MERCLSHVQHIGHKGEVDVARGWKRGRDGGEEECDEAFTFEVAGADERRVSFVVGGQEGRAAGEEEGS